MDPRKRKGIEGLEPSTRKRRASPEPETKPLPRWNTNRAAATTDCGARLMRADELTVQRAVRRLPEHLQPLVEQLNDTWQELPDQVKAQFFQLENPSDRDLELLCSSVLPAFQRFCQSSALDWYWKARLGFSEHECWYDAWRKRQRQDLTYVS